MKERQQNAAPRESNHARRLNLLRRCMPILRPTWSTQQSPPIRPSHSSYPWMKNNKALISSPSAGAYVRRCNTSSRVLTMNSSPWYQPPLQPFSATTRPAQKRNEAEEQRQMTMDRKQKACVGVPAAHLICVHHLYLLRSNTRATAVGVVTRSL